MEKKSSRIPNTENNTEFDDLLRLAKLETALPASFQSEVWRRIAAEQDASLSCRVSRWMERALGGLVQPVAATSAVLVTVSAGMLFGSMTERRTPDGRVAYIESVSPFAQSHLEENR